MLFTVCRTACWLLLFHFFSPICIAALPYPDTSQAPVRGVWLTNVGSQVLYSRAGIEAAVDRCARSGINHIFVVMWNKGRTLYPSRLMEQTFGLPIDEKLTGRDPLRELLDAARPHHIRVYAWFEYGFAAENRGLGEHILRTKPNWAARNTQGEVLVKNGFRWMNGFDSEVQAFMLGLLSEVVQQYPDLTGIQGDDRLPAMPVESGYNPGIVAAYRAEHHGMAPPANPRDTAWVSWRANRMNAFMKQLRTTLKRVRPSVQIAMAPSIYPFSKTDYLQDWPTWVRNGWVDLVCPQIYRYDIALYRKELGRILREQVPASEHHRLAPGLLVRLEGRTFSDDFLRQMIETNRANGVAGELFFYYEGLPEHPAFFDWYRTQ